MTLQELRNLFAQDTEFVLQGYADDKTITMTNLLWGNLSLAKLLVYNLEVKDNKIVVFVDMPKPVFNAWKRYAESWESR